LAGDEFHEDERRWHVTAVDARPRGRKARHEAISGIRAAEIEALAELARELQAPAG
jgi:hypothetical protein